MQSLAGAPIRNAQKGSAVIYCSPLGTTLKTLKGSSVRDVRWQKVILKCWISSVSALKVQIHRYLSQKLLPAPVSLQFYATFSSCPPALPNCILTAICRKCMHSCLPRSSDTQVFAENAVNSDRVFKKSRIARAWETQVHTFAINSNQNALQNSLENRLWPLKFAFL